MGGGKARLYHHYLVVDWGHLLYTFPFTHWDLVFKPKYCLRVGKYVLRKVNTHRSSESFWRDYSIYVVQVERVKEGSCVYYYYHLFLCICIFSCAWWVWVVQWRYAGCGGGCGCLGGVHCSLMAVIQSLWGREEGRKAMHSLLTVLNAIRHLCEGWHLRIYCFINLFHVCLILLMYFKLDEFLVLLWKEEEGVTCFAFILIILFSFFLLLLILSSSSLLLYKITTSEHGMDTKKHQLFCWENILPKRHHWV